MNDIDEIIKTYTALLLQMHLFNDMFKYWRPFKGISLIQCDPYLIANLGAYLTNPNPYYQEIKIFAGVEIKLLEVKL